MTFKIKVKQKRPKLKVLADLLAENRSKLSLYYCEKGQVFLIGMMPSYKRIFFHSTMTVNETGTALEDSVVASGVEAVSEEEEGDTGVEAATTTTEMDFTTGDRSTEEVR